MHEHKIQVVETSHFLFACTEFASNDSIEKKHQFTTSEIKDALAHLKNEDEVFHILDLACEIAGSRFIQENLAILLEKRLRELNGNESLQFSTDVEIEIKVHRIDIPDPSRNEIMLSLSIDTSANLNSVVSAIGKLGSITTDNIQKLKSRWLNSDLAISVDNEHRHLLDSIMGVFVDGTSEIKYQSTSYNTWISGEKSMVYRSWDAVIVLQHSMQLRNYPFDISFVNIIARPDGVCGIGELKYSIADLKYPLDIRKMTLPSGFESIPKMETISTNAFSEGQLFVPVSACLATIPLKRNPKSQILRNLLPIYLISGFGFVATTLAMLTNEFVPDTMTAIIPSVLIALVALQLAVASNLPPNSSVTLLDKLFILSYVGVLFEFLLLACCAIQDFKIAIPIFFSLIILILVFSVFYSGFTMFRQLKLVKNPVN